MPNVVVLDDSNSTMEGMTWAGQHISDWMKERKKKDYVDFFDDLFDGAIAENHTVNLEMGGAYDPVTDPNGDGNYQLGDGRRFVPVPVRDGKQGKDKGNKKKPLRMTISIPEEEGELVDPAPDPSNPDMSIYAHQIAKDIIELAGFSYTDLTSDEMKAVHQYLVAVAFLNRCQ